MTFIFMTLLTSIAIADEPVRVSKWEYTPNIEICPSSSLSKKDIIEGFNYWNSHSSQKITYKSIKYVDYCDRNARKDLVIRVMDLQESDKTSDLNYAVTSSNNWWYEGSPNQVYIQNVRMKIPEESNHVRIIAHELGHAYGFVHSDHFLMEASFSIN